MAENSKIEWVRKKYPDGRIVPGHTHNEWEGCFKVSPACKFCYAETRNIRFYQGRHWGPPSTTPRRLTSEHNRNNLMRYDRKAREEGVRPFVFLMSLADVFEDHPLCNEWRPALIEKIIKYDHLDYLMLTKRPENVLQFTPEAWHTNWPEHVWLGCSVEDQEWADKRREAMANIPAKHKFVSYEPALGRVDWSGWETIIDWMLTGGESGHTPRPSHPAWFRDTRDWCIENGIAHHFKQWGELLPETEIQQRADEYLDLISLTKESIIVWDEDKDPMPIWNVGKKVAGRLLDGRTWDEFPGMNN